METAEHPEPAEETFAQVLAALKSEYGVNDSEISRRIGAHVSTVNNWANGKPTPGRGAVRTLAAVGPIVTAAGIFGALGTRPPAPLRADEREQLLDVFDRLTEEQRQILFIQASAVADSNE